MNYKRLFIPNSYIFVTVVTYKRNPILIDNIEILRKAFKTALEKYSFEIIAITINYDHLHMIIKPETIENYPKIIGTIKAAFTKLSKLHYVINNNREANIWQRRYWEHTIINEEDFYRHLDYIHYNSLKHYNISPRNWQYSTFKKFVEMGCYDINWCNQDDKNKIVQLDYE